MSRRYADSLRYQGGEPESVQALVDDNNNKIRVPWCFDLTAMIDYCYVWDIRTWHETLREQGNVI